MMDALSRASGYVFSPIMPLFEAHKRLAQKIGYVLGSLLGIIALVDTGDIVFSGIVFSLSLFSVYVGGGAPDIDSYSSIPRRKFNRLMQLTAAGVLVAIALYVGGILVNFSGSPLLIGAVSVSLPAIGWVVRSIPERIQQIMPPHRGLLHTVGFWAFVTAITYLSIRTGLQSLEASSFVVTYFPIVCTLSFLVGAIGHIAQDRAASFVKENPVVGKAVSWAPTKKPVILDIPQFVRIFFRRGTPWTVRLMVIGVILYGVMPLDVITDVIPILGWSDDFGTYLFLRETVYRAAETGESAVHSALSVMRSWFVTISLIVGLIVVAAFSWGYL